MIVEFTELGSLDDFRAAGELSKLSIDEQLQLGIDVCHGLKVMQTVFKHGARYKAKLCNLGLSRCPIPASQPPNPISNHSLRLL